MPIAWNAVATSHVVQFYESQCFLHCGIAAFFAEGLRRGDTLVMIARPGTFEAVAEHLASGRYGPPIDATDHILFKDVHAALAEIMDGGAPDQARFERAMAHLVSGAGANRHEGPIRAYGEIVDVLCGQGNHAAAVALEEIWNRLCAERSVSLLCGYAMEDFDDDLDATQFRAVCGQHTHIIPPEGFADVPGDRRRLERVVLLQQRARALGRVLTPTPPPAPPAAVAPHAPTIYVIDDDASVRRSLARLFSSVDLQARTFGSAEAFLSEVDESSSGCLIVDVQLAGMSGPSLQSQLAAARWSMPIIAMSGSHELEIEAEALRRGAKAFLRKPFDAVALLDTIALTLSQTRAAARS